MDRFELGVRDGRPYEGREVPAVGEGVPRAQLRRACHEGAMRGSGRGQANRSIVADRAGFTLSDRARAWTVATAEFGG